MFARINNYLKMIYTKIAQSFALIFFIAGFLFDIYTLGKRVQVGDLYMIGLYIIAATGILIILCYQRKNQIENDELLEFRCEEDTVELSYHEKLLFFIRYDAAYYTLQFIWGSLSSALLILYFKSSGHYLAMLFCLFLAIILILNEKLLPLYRSSMTVLWGLYSFTLMLWLNFTLPYLINSLFSSLFYFTTLFTLIICYIIYYLIKKYIAKNNIQVCGKSYLILINFLVLILLNFTDVIPPVPLIKKNHLLGTELNKYNYSLVVQLTPWWNFWRKYENNLALSENNRLYFAASVFAPTLLQTEIMHIWQQKAPNGSWRDKQNVKFTMSGGRDDGFRGYSYKTNIQPGDWRIIIKSENNRTLEVVNFTINISDSNSELLQRINL